MVSSKLLLAVIVAAIIVVAGSYFVYNNEQTTKKTTLYTVSISEVGLPNGMNWRVSAGNHTSGYIGTGSFVNFQLDDGAYDVIAVAADSTYFSLGKNITVSNSDQSVIVDFSAIPQDIAAVNVNFNYKGLSSGYFGSSTQTFSGFSYHAGINITEVFTLYSNAILLDHNISKVITDTQGFKVVATTPNLPVTISPGGSVTITLTVSTPLTSYSGVLDLIVDTY